MKIGYVCTNYNNSRYTLEAAKSLLANAGHDIRVVVVDNQSRPDGVEFLRQHMADLPGVDVLFNPENRGYFRGLNDGLRHLRKECPEIEYAIVGNNDLVFPQNFVDAVDRAQALFETRPVISPDIVTIDGEHQNPHVISKISKARELVYDVYYSNYYVGLAIRWAARMLRRFATRPDMDSHAIAGEIYQGHGACYILGPIFFREFGELWAPTFLMHEEYFLSKQLMDKGFRVYYEPSIMVQHHWHASMATIPGRRAWEAARDAHRVYRRYVKVFP